MMPAASPNGKLFLLRRDSIPIRYVAAELLFCGREPWLFGPDRGRAAAASLLFAWSQAQARLGSRVVGPRRGVGDRARRHPNACQAGRRGHTRWRSILVVSHQLDRLFVDSA